MSADAHRPTSRRILVSNRPPPPSLIEILSSNYRDIAGDSGTSSEARSLGRLSG